MGSCSNREWGAKSNAMVTRTESWLSQGGSRAAPYMTVDVQPRVQIIRQVCGDEAGPSSSWQSICRSGSDPVRETKVTISEQVCGDEMRPKPSAHRSGSRSAGPTARLETGTPTFYLQQGLREFQGLWTGVGGDPG